MSSASIADTASATRVLPLSPGALVTPIWTVPSPALSPETADESRWAMILAKYSNDRGLRRKKRVKASFGNPRSWVRCAAITVAERRSPRITAISPKKSPARRRASRSGGSAALQTSSSPFSTM